MSHVTDVITIGCARGHVRRPFSSAGEASIKGTSSQEDYQGSAVLFQVTPIVVPHQSPRDVVEKTP